MNFFRLPALALAFVLVLPATAEESAPLAYKNLLTPLFKGNETIVGQKIAYPAGEPKVTGWHTHQVPLFVTVMDGEVSVDYGSKGVKLYKAGDSFLEAMDWPHNATNKTDAIVRIMAVYMGADGKADAAPAAGAQ
jgi:quercetin dioxygenase-like cupin family protein